MGDVVELLAADGFELLAAGLEFFVDLDGLLGHRLVGFLRAADERKVRAGGDALVPVGIQADTEQRGLAFDFFAFAI
jgi:hypothetical protein